MGPRCSRPSRSRKPRPQPLTAQSRRRAAAASDTSFQGNWRGSKLVGLSVYNESNESLGSINDLLMDKSGNIKGVVIGVGGFLGVGEHLVALPFDKVKFVNEPIVYTGTAGGGSATGTRPGHHHHGRGQHRSGCNAGEAQSVVSGPCRDQRHQGSAEGDARVQILDLRQRRA